jgi:predicted dehydrogenase
MPWPIPSSVLGADGATAPSNRINAAVIGVGAMGGGHMRHLASSPAFQLVAICDVDRQRRNEGREVVDATYAASAPGGGYRGCAAINDYRELLARPDIDAVVIATPDHWHALLSIEAARAGKDVYCEKPISVTVEEGRLVADVMRRYGRIFQTGTQYRSIPVVRKICQFIRDGGLGKVRAVFTLLNNVGLWTGAPRFKPYADVVNADTAGRRYEPIDVALPAEAVPDGLDWDLWVGPAPFRPYNPMYHANPSPGVVPWSFDEAFGVTSLTWHLAHSADVIQWALGKERSGPVEIIHPSTGEFPTLTCRYDNGTLLHFVDHWGLVKDAYHALPADARLAGNFGGVFVGEKGWITTMSTGGPIEGAPESLFDEIGLKRREVNIGANTHHANWVECIRSREVPWCDAEIGHRTATLGHLTNIASRLGCSLRWQPEKERFAGNPTADRLLGRPMRAPWRA